MIDKTTTDAVADVVQKEKHKRPKRSENYQVHTEPGDNARYIRHNLKLMQLPDVDFTDKNAVEDRIDQYFTLCAENDMKPSVEGMALAFGIDRRTLWKYASGGTKSVPLEVVDTIKKAYSMLNAQMADFMQNGKINPVAGIFLMKNNMAYRDETEVIIKPDQALGEIQEADVIADKYKLLPAEEQNE